MGDEIEVNVNEDAPQEPDSVTVNVDVVNEQPTESETWQQTEEIQEQLEEIQSENQAELLGEAAILSELQTINQMLEMRLAAIEALLQAGSNSTLETLSPITPDVAEETPMQPKRKNLLLRLLT